ncbi:MAG TPA: HisA/HisF-related TIM barrel protein [Candidatus Limnocylindrales bacterium]
MLVIPSIDLAGGKSRVVFWPGVSAGVGAPTDRPERIAQHFVRLGAPLVHLVDFDGARAGRPVNLEAVGAIAGRIATPLQLAGGVEDPAAIQLAFASGATRVVSSMALADDPEQLRACVAVAGDWLAVGLDARPERLAAFPWRHGPPQTVAALVDLLAAAGVRRIVSGHTADLDEVAGAARAADVEVLVAGGARDLDALRRVRDAGVAGIILGEALLSGAIDYVAAREAVA